MGICFDSKYSNYSHSLVADASLELYSNKSIAATKLTTQSREALKRLGYRIKTNNVVKIKPIRRS